MSVTTVMSGEWVLSKKQTRSNIRARLEKAGEVVMPREAGYLAIGDRCKPRPIRGDVSKFMGEVG